MLSVVVLAKNEEQSIARTLKSVIHADEIIVIDDESTDKTREIAESAGVRVVSHASHFDFAEQRNFGMSQAKGDWILFLDADEVLTDELNNAIQKVVQDDTNKKAYRLKRRDFFWGHQVKYGEVSDAYNHGIIRLVKADAGTWIQPIHEEFKLDDPAGSAGVLHGYIDHYAHQSVKEFLEHVNSYSTIRAKELKRQGKITNWFEIIAYPVGKFLYTFLIKTGFRDGIRGFIYSFMMAFHSFLVRSKLYLSQQS